MTRNQDFNPDAALARAVKHFWKTRSRQHASQGTASGSKDVGMRGAVTGGKHADGFVSMIADIVKRAGLAETNVSYVGRGGRTLPGYFRPAKDWDLVVTSGDTLVAVVEVKSQVGSFGNNYNNRIEEALGNATDFWKAYAKGLYAPSPQPWLGYLFMLEDAPGSRAAKREVLLKPFPIDAAFQRMSYAQRYQETCLRLVRERMYDAACFFLSSQTDGLSGKFVEPNAELSFRHFATSLSARASAVANAQHKA